MTKLKWTLQELKESLQAWLQQSEIVEQYQCSYQSASTSLYPVTLTFYIMNKQYNAYNKTNKIINKQCKGKKLLWKMRTIKYISNTTTNI